jgi:hypothetical protein
MKCHGGLIMVMGPSFISDVGDGGGRKRRNSVGNSGKNCVGQTFFQSFFFFFFGRRRENI